MDFSWETFGFSTVAAAVVAALFSWLGKIWATRIANRELAFHAQELERYKRQANAELEAFRSDLQKKKFVHRIQFEKEFKIYEKIWEYLVPLDEAVRHLRPVFEFADGKKDEEKFDERYNKNFVPSYNEYAKAVLSRRPFIPESVYRILRGIMEVASSEGWDYVIIPKPKFGMPQNKDYYDQAKENMRELAKLIDKACTVIRNRINIVEVVGTTGTEDLPM